VGDSEGEALAVGVAPALEGTDGVLLGFGVDFGDPVDDGVADGVTTGVSVIVTVGTGDGGWCR
jgi:hypothetical protein